MTFKANKIINTARCNTTNGVAVQKVTVYYELGSFESFLYNVKHFSTENYEKVETELLVKTKKNKKTQIDRFYLQYTIIKQKLLKFH